MSAKSKQHTGLLLFTLAVGTFMAALDASAVTIVLPAIQSHFHTAISAVEWVVTAYLLVVSSLLLTFGRLSDLHGQKRLYTAGFVVFTAGSLLCGLSFSLPMLIASRVFQALGASMLFSCSSAIIAANVPPQRRGKAFGMIAVAVAVALCAGPVLGGLLATAWGWQSIFFINLPIGILGVVLCIKNIPADTRQAAEPFDKWGGALLFAALFLLLLPLDLAGNGDIAGAPFAGLLIGGLALTALFIWRQSRAAHPLLRLELFRDRVFSASLLAAVLNYIAQFIITFLTPFYLEKVRMLSPMMTGLLYIPMPLATMLTAPVSGSLSDRYDSRVFSAAGMAIMTVGFVLLSFVRVDTSFAFIMIAMMIAGAGSGLFQSPNNSAIMNHAPAAYRGVASGTLATMRNIGMVLGVALSGALFHFSTDRAEQAMATHGMSGSALRRLSQTQGVEITFFAAAIVAVLAMIAALVKGKVRPVTGGSSTAVQESVKEN